MPCFHVEKVRTVRTSTPFLLGWSYYRSKWAERLTHCLQAPCTLTLRDACRERRASPPTSPFKNTHFCSLVSATMLCTCATRRSILQQLPWHRPPGLPSLPFNPLNEGYPSWGHTSGEALTIRNSFPSHRESFLVMRPRISPGMQATQIHLI